MRTAPTPPLLLAVALWSGPTAAWAAGPMPAPDANEPEGLSPVPTAAAPAALPLAAPPLCEAPKVTLLRGKGRPSEPVSVALTLCDGRPNPDAARVLAVLSRPGTAEPEEAPGHLEPALLSRLQAVADHFEGRSLELVSGYRPNARTSSRHRHGAAVDLRVSGVDNAALRDFARTLPATGVGYYPNSSFVHIDVRDDSYYWVDTSGPGERAQYVRDPEAEHPEGEADPLPDALAAATGAAAEPDPQPADLTLELDEVEAYLAQAEVTGLLDPSPDASAESAPDAEPALAAEGAPETESVLETEGALDAEPALDAEVAEAPSPAVDTAEAPLDAQPTPLATPEPAVAQSAVVAELPDPEALAANRASTAPFSLASDPELFALAEHGPTTPEELQSLAGRAVHAVLAALPTTASLDSRLPSR